MNQNPNPNPNLVPFAAPAAKTFHAHIYLDSIGIDGEGKTAEEAEAKVRKELARYVHVNIFTIDEDGTELPKLFYPDTIPINCGLVYLQGISHNDGRPYGSLRIVAVPMGQALTGNGTILVNKPVAYEQVVDSNSEYAYDLPPGSFELQNGEWKPQHEVRYYY